MIDSWQDQNKDTELSDKKKAVIRKLEKSVCDEEVPEKKIKLVEVDEDSDDDFAAQLLEGNDDERIYLNMINQGMKLTFFKEPHGS